MRILKETPVPVVPMALTGLWDSMFSRKYGALWRRWPRRFWPRIGLVVGPSIPPENANLQVLREAVVGLRGAAR
jgi:1-acyl-sn-glycerol-3-phosphate acyltransferase